MIGNGKKWVLCLAEGGQEKYFSANHLPVSLGGNPSDDVRLNNVSGSLQIDMLDEAFFVLPARDTNGLRINGELLSGSRWLRDGDIIALDTARLSCTLSSNRLSLMIDVQVTGSDTVPPDLEELARESDDLGDIEIAPVAFRPRLKEQTDSHFFRPSKRFLGVGSGLVTLAVVGWFAFTAKSVQLVFTPQPEAVSLPGTFFKLQLADRYLLRFGTHRISATLLGYHTLETEIDVGLSPDQSFELSLKRLPGLISVSVDSNLDTDVYVDGQLLGSAPLVDAEVSTGLRRFEFMADRYLSEIREFEVIGGGERQNMSAVLTPNWSPVTLITEPVSARVFVDDVSLGGTPLVMELAAGERRIEARLEGFNIWKSTILVNADQPLELPLVMLSPADGQLELTSNPADAVVSVDGKYRGRTPLTLGLLPDRDHQIGLTKPGYDPVMQVLSVAADSQQELDINLVAQLGEVGINSEPTGAAIWVDGERQGNTPTRLMLMAISHQLEIGYPGFASQSVEITPRPGFPQILEFKLEELDVTTGSGYPKVVETSLGQDLLLVLPGEFIMGSSRREQGRRSNESMRTVRLSTAFYLGAREVSNAEFRKFKPEHNSGSFSGVSLDEDDQPVVRVTWGEVAQFLNWLSITDGFQPAYEERQGTRVLVRPVRNGYRLPTEAEWAWASRFAEREEALIYPWGAELPPPDRTGNYADVSASQLLRTTLITYNDSFQVAAPVGSFGPSLLGFFDLGGNVSEWMQDYYEIATIGVEGVVKDPLGPEIGSLHVVRGSSWTSATLTNLRLAYRDYNGSAREDLGFRIARNLE